MKNLILIFSLIAFYPIIFAQNNTTSKNVARIISKNLGTANGHVFVLSEHLNEAFRHLSGENGEKKYLYDRTISIAEYSESGFIKNIVITELPNFPKENEVFDVVLANNKQFYILSGKKENGHFDGEISCYDLALKTKLDEHYSVHFEEVKNKYNLSLLCRENKLLAINSCLLYKEKTTLIETVAIDLNNENQTTSSKQITPKQFMNLNDWFLDENENLKLIFSTEKPEWDINPEDKNFKNIATIFINCNGNEVEVKEYDYQSNAEFVPSNFRFVQVNKDELLIVAIAIPKTTENAGYFISKNAVSSPLNFSSDNVVIPADYRNPKFWSSLEEPALNKGKCPVKYRKQSLERVLFEDGRLIFIENSYGYTGDEGLVHQGNFSVAVFDLNDNKPVSFFRSENRDCPIQGYCKSSGILVNYSNNQLLTYYLTMKHDDAFNVTKKEFGLSEVSRLIQCNIDLNTGLATQQYIPSTTGSPYMDLGPAFFNENSFFYFVCERGIDYHNIPKLKIAKQP